MDKVVICGLGAVGLTYAVKFLDTKNCELKILVNEARKERYLKDKPIFNGKKYDFDYILPNENYDADLIIIAVKSHGLSSAISSIINCVGKNTTILSLMNGISSEEQIKLAYPQAKVLYSYFIGHSAVRKDNIVTQDGVGEIVTEEKIPIFERCNINYSISEDIVYSMWLKYTFNLFANQISSILGMTFGELRRNAKFIALAKKIIQEVKLIAEKVGVQNLDKLEDDAIKALSLMCDEGKTSMLRDIIAKRPTEVDIFAGEIIRLGKQYGISTPYNQALYDLIKIEEENNEHCIHTC